MPNYRIYLMSGDRVRSAHDFKCETDAYALTQAQSMLGEHSKAEVWLGETKVGCVVLDKSFAGTKSQDTSDDRASQKLADALKVDCIRSNVEMTCFLAASRIGCGPSGDCLAVDDQKVFTLAVLHGDPNARLPHLPIERWPHQSWL